nr:immunoglobulin heavy chain junction region [Macaca mulatta]
CATKMQWVQLEGHFEYW